MEPARSRRKGPGIWENYFDVVILPPQAVGDHAIALSKQLAKYGGQFVLGRSRFIPHISLYHVPVRPENFRLFSREVKELAAVSSGGTLRFRRIEMPVLMTDKPRWIKRLHLDVVKRTGRYFDWDYGAEEFWSIDSLPSKLRVRAKEYLGKFGSPMIDAVFRPHITLTSFRGAGGAGDVPLPEFEPMSFQVDAISICELGPHHSCQRMVAKFPLKSE